MLSWLSVDLALASPRSVSPKHRGWKGLGHQGHGASRQGGSRSPMVLAVFLSLPFRWELVLGPVRLLPGSHAPCPRHRSWSLALWFSENPVTQHHSAAQQAGDKAALVGDLRQHSGSALTSLWSPNTSTCVHRCCMAVPGTGPQSRAHQDSGSPSALLESGCYQADSPGTGTQGRPGTWCPGRRWCCPGRAMPWASPDSPEREL